MFSRSTRNFQTFRARDPLLQREWISSPVPASMADPKIFRRTFSCGLRRIAWPARVALCAVLLLSVRCAYLNTLYNGKVAFQKAFREHMGFLQTRTDTSVALPKSVTEGYERAVEKAAKTIEVYPKRKRWHDDAVFLMGKALFCKGEMTAAIRRFGRLQKEFPESPFIPESYLYLAKAYMGDGRLQKAEETLRFVLEKYPHLNDNEEVTLLLAQVAIEREGKVQAIEILEKILESAKSDERRLEVLLKMAALYIDLKLHAKAEKVLSGAPRKRGYYGYLYRVDLYLLVCYTELGKLDKALFLANKMLKDKHFVEHLSTILLHKARAQRKAGEFDEAISSLERITKSKETGNVVGEAWFELALIYQQDKSDFDKALECYEKARSFVTDEDLREVANTRAEGIRQLNQYSEILAERVTDTAEIAVGALSEVVTRYKMGEVYWLNLSEADSALSSFAAITADTTADSATVLKALYARAWIWLHMKRDTTAADKLYRALISSYPTTLYAQKSQRELGIPVTVETREDSARQAFMDAEDLYFENSNARAASNAFYRAAKRYADFPDISARSTYAAAWLCDNVLGKDVTARKLYRMLCDSFPETDYCAEVRPRLKVVEDTLRIIKTEKRRKGPAEKDGGESGDLIEEGDSAGGGGAEEEAVVADSSVDNAGDTPVDSVVAPEIPGKGTEPASMPPVMGRGEPRNEAPARNPRPSLSEEETTIEETTIDE